MRIRYPCKRCGTFEDFCACRTLAALRRLRRRAVCAHDMIAKGDSPYTDGCKCGYNDARIWIDREIERAKGGGRGK